MANGTVKWFNDKKGYGFIEQEDGPDAFVHHSGINATGFKTLKEGEKVCFHVKKGDLLIELDSSDLLDRQIDQEIRVQNAEASFIRARENLAVAENQAKSDIDKAELTFEFAKQDLTKYNEGEYPNQLKESESRITLAQEKVQRAEEKLMSD